jgi:L-ascorbate metabolism protein UlaG (beta-lactamase superfamily)
VKTILVTGAGGKVGRVLCPALAAHYVVRVLDREPIEAVATGARFVGDINDSELLDRAMLDVHAVVHLAGAASAQADFEEILTANISGTYNVYEAARRNGVPRVVFASTNRTVENLSPLKSASSDELPISTDDPARPDSLYGVSKLFGEELAKYYFDAHAVSSVCIRLGSVTTKRGDPYLTKPRAHALWLSQRDLVELFRCSIEAPEIDCITVFGISANTRRWWNIEPGHERIGFRPRDDGEFCLPPVVAPRSYRIPWGQRLAELRVPLDRIALVSLGQSGFFLAARDYPNIAIDPFLTMWPDRLQQPLLAPEDLPADLVLITHTHRDHLDADGLPPLAAQRPTTRFIAPPTACDRLIELGIEAARIVTLQPGEVFDADGARITAVEARHRPTTPDAQGYSISIGAHTVYHTGDTEFDPCLMSRATLSPSVLLVPINGRKGNMTAEQAAMLACNLGACVTIPMHYGCLQPTGDLLDRFLAEMDRVAPNSAVVTMEPGAIRMFPEVVCGGVS